MSDQLIEVSGGRWLDRHDKCPKGVPLQPGCEICRKCEYFHSKTWYANGLQGWNLVYCLFKEGGKQ